MIAVDTNLLVYSHREDSEWHAAAKACLVDLADSGSAWAIAWSSLHEFIAVVTHPRIYAPPTPQATACAAIRSWLESPGLQLLHEGPGYLDKLERLCVRARIAGGRTHDARIAAICLNHGVAELWTADRDFSLFPELKTRNPLLGGSKRRKPDA
jgi:toxin-antitoxin system PIN domain toxin